MIQYKNILEIKDNRHSCAKLKTYHFSGEEHYKVVDSLYRMNEDWSDSAVLAVMKLRENDWPEDFINTLSLALDKMPDSVSNYIYNRVSGHGYSITSSEGKNKAFDFFFDVLCHENGLNQKERDSLLKVLG